MLAEQSFRADFTIECLLESDSAETLRGGELRGKTAPAGRGLGRRVTL